jgi:hypothetical protein
VHFQHGRLSSAGLQFDIRKLASDLKGRSVSAFPVTGLLKMMWLFYLCAMRETNKTIEALR